MSDIKPWHIVLIVVAAGVVAFSGWRFINQGKIETPSGYMTVDIMTGQLYLIQKGKAKGMLLPALHPKTKNRTLYPVVREENSDQWILDPGYTGSLTENIRNQTDMLSGDKIDILETDPVVFVLR